MEKFLNAIRLLKIVVGESIKYAYDQKALRIPDGHYIMHVTIKNGEVLTTWEAHEILS